MGEGGQAFPAEQHLYGMAFGCADLAGDDGAWRTAELQGVVDEGVVLRIGNLSADGVGSAPDLVSIDILHGRGQRPDQP